MDQELRELERAAESEPTDRDAAQRYDEALGKAGRRADVLERYRAKYLCSQLSELGPLGMFDIPTCNGAGCSRTTEISWNPSDPMDILLGGDNLAHDPGAIDGLLQRLMDDARFHSARENDSPCVLPHVVRDMCPGCGRG